MSRIDPTGLKPGEKFNSIREAAKDAADYYNPQTVGNDKEMTAIILSNNDGTFTYKDIANAAADPKLGFYVSWTESNVVGFFHTHVFYDVNNPNEDFSSPGNSTGPNGTDDQSFADNNGIPIFVGTPTGKVKEYDPATQ